MNELQIKHLLANNIVTRHTFSGTYALDEIPYFEHNAHYILNLDPRAYPGSHWILIVRDSNGCINHFCSSGMPPYDPILLKKLKRYPVILYSPDVIQSPYSRSCGLFCALISYLMSCGNSLRESV